LIHEAIRQRFSFENSMLNTYKSQIKKLETLIKNNNNINDRRKFTREKDKLELKIKEYSDSKIWNIYIDKTKKYLLEYAKIVSEKTSKKP